MSGTVAAMTKYPRTPHLPWSENTTPDDRRMLSLEGLVGEEVVITEKYDGEGTTFYKDYLHARSLENLGSHPSRAWVKGFWASIRHNIPDGMRICGENVFAKHSISYTELPSYFLGFSVWNLSTCLDWQETVDIFDLLGIVPVPVLWQGKFVSENHVYNTIRGLGAPNREGYVIRVARAFEKDEFSKVVGKYVRPGHVQVDAEHWFQQKIQPNRLAPKETVIIKP